MVKDDRAEQSRRILPCNEISLTPEGSRFPAKKGKGERGPDQSRSGLRVGGELASETHQDICAMAPDFTRCPQITFSYYMYRHKT